MEQEWRGEWSGEGGEAELMGDASLQRTRERLPEEEEFVRACEGA